MLINYIVYSEDVNRRGTERAEVQHKAALQPNPYRAVTTLGMRFCFMYLLLFYNYLPRE